MSMLERYMYLDLYILLLNMEYIHSVYMNEIHNFITLYFVFPSSMLNIFNQVFYLFYTYPL